MMATLPLRDSRSELSNITSVITEDRLGVVDLVVTKQAEPTI